MREKCTIRPSVKRADGTIVESILFRELHKYIGDYERAKKAYGLLSSPKYAVDFEDAPKDINGEPTIDSFFDITGLNDESIKTKKILNEELEAGEYTGDEAYQKVQTFNETNSDHRYMATMQENENGKYQIYVVENTPANEDELKDAIYNKELKEYILNRLSALGIGVDYLSSEDSRDGVFTTINAEKLANGLLALIKVNPNSDNAKTLATQAGHFVFAALHDTKLAQRLEKLLSDDNVRQAAMAFISSDYDEYEADRVASESPRELAGELIGLSIVNTKRIPSALASAFNFCRNLFKAAKNIITGHIAEAQILIDKANAQSKANKALRIAQREGKKFIKGKDRIAVQEIFKKKEEYYSAKLTANEKASKGASEIIESLAKQLMSLRDPGTTELAQSMLGSIDVNKNNFTFGSKGMLADRNTMNNIVSITFTISQLMGKQVDSLLASINDNQDEFIIHQAPNAKALREISMILDHSTRLIDLLEMYIEQLKGYDKTNFSPSKETHSAIVTWKDEHDRAKQIDLYKLFDQLQERNAYMRGKYDVARDRVVLSYMEHVLGSSSIDTQARIVLGKGQRWKRLQYRTGTNTTVAEMLKFYNEDIDLIDRYILSAGNSSDNVIQLADRTRKQLDQLHNKQILTARKILQDFHKRLEALGIKDTRELCEVDEEGKLTGNILTPYRMDAFYDEYKKFMDAKRAELEEDKETKAHLNEMTNIGRRFLVNKQLKQASKEWFKEHTNPKIILANGKAAPTDEYLNPQYIELCAKYPGIKNLLKEIWDFKLGIDAELLPPHSTSSWRLPQFVGSSFDVIKNRMNLYDENVAEALARSKWESFKQKFITTIEDEDFGAVDEDMDNMSITEKTQVRMLPIYGIRKNPNPERVSTDIIQSLMAYFGMASEYALLEKNTNVLELLADAFNSRKYRDENNNEKVGREAQAYGRLRDELDMNFYNRRKNAIGIEIGNKSIRLDKLVSWWSSFASNMYLGWNFHGGLVNDMTGWNEMIKEGLAGEFFTEKQLAKAASIYAKYIPWTMMEIGSPTKNNPVDRLIDAFDILDNKHERLHNMHLSRPQLLNVTVSDMAYFPYTSGDRFMRAIPLIAMMQGEQISTLSGETMSLWEAYEKGEYDPTTDTITSKSMAKDAVSAIEMQKWLDIKNIISNFNEDVVTGTLNLKENAFASPLNYMTAEQRKMLEDAHINMEIAKDQPVKALKNILELVEERLKQYAFDSTSFVIKVKEVNNRMHGVMNEIDAPALKRTVIGRALFALKNYATGLFTRRFTKDRYNINLGIQDEGSANTFIKQVFSLFHADLNNSSGFANVALVLFNIACPWAAQQLFQDNFDKWSAHQRANMKRTAADVYMVILFKLLAHLFRPPKDRDEDDEWKDKMESDPNFMALCGMLYYFTTRAGNEQGAYTVFSPKELTTEFLNVLDPIPSAGSAVFDLLSIMYKSVATPLDKYVLNDVDSEGYKSNSNLWYVNKTHKVNTIEQIHTAMNEKFGTSLDEEGISKVEVQLLSLSPLKSLFVFKNGYEAAKAYEFSRRMRGK